MTGAGDRAERKADDNRSLVLLDAAEFQHGATITGRTPLAATMPDTSWSFGLLFPLDPDVLSDMGGRALVRIRAHVAGGPIGVAGTNRDGALTTAEYGLGEGANDVELVLRRSTPSDFLVFRSQAVSGAPPRITIEGITHRSCLLAAPRNRLFAVVSWGSAATNWLSTILTTHPDIFCVHAANRVFRRRAGGRLLDGLEYMALIDQLAGGAPVGGDVHGVARDQIADLHEVLGEKFRAAIVVRDPVKRLQSQLALFASATSTPWSIDHLNPLIERCGFNPATLPYKERLFFHGANLLNSILAERAIAPVYRCEDLTSSSQALLDLVDHISGSSVPRLEGWAAQAVTRKPISVRAGATPPPLAGWQERALLDVVKPETWEAYEALGYATPHA
jgi:hypothetical protein